MRRTFIGHANRVEVLAFSPVGRFLASGSYDTTVLIWDVYAPMRKDRHDLTGERLATLWADLGDADAARAGAAIAELVSHPDRARALLREKLTRATLPEPRRLRQLVAELDNDDFAVREKAARALEDLGDLAEPALKGALAGKPGAELRKWADELLEKLHDGRLTSAAVLRGVRGVEVLEAVATPEARRVLEDLATGGREARLTREAKAALERLKRRVSHP